MRSNAPSVAIQVLPKLYPKPLHYRSRSAFLFSPLLNVVRKEREREREREGKGERRKSKHGHEEIG